MLLLKKLAWLPVALLLKCGPPGHRIIWSVLRLRQGFVLGVCIVVINIKDWSVLVIIKRRGFNPGACELPGGGIDAKDNSFETAVIRELFQETNLIAKTIAWFGNYKSQRYKRSANAVYVVTEYEGNLKVNDEFEIEDVFFVPIIDRKSTR